MSDERLVGIVSDTHDNLPAIHRAVEVFNDAGCSLIVHAGDYIAPFTAREFEKLTGEFVGVFGNNDGEKKGLADQFSRFGNLFEPPHEFVWGGKNFMVMHAPDRLGKNVNRDGLDVIVYGHLHETDLRQGQPLVINPGECCGWLTGRTTVALLDLETMKADILDLT